MPTKMTMPQLGESVTEGTISKWLVNPGDKVNKYDPIAEVLTDKVSAEIPSSYTGTIEALLVQEDDTVAVGTEICAIETGEGGETAETATPMKEEPIRSSEKSVSSEKSPAPAAQKPQAGTSQKTRYSPAVMRLAGEHNIDLNEVSGSGRGGRITRKDLEAIIAEGGQTTPSPALAEREIPSASASPQEESASMPSLTTAEGDVEIPLSGVRKAIASNMVKSKREAPHAWTMVEVDVTNLVKLRQSKKEAFKQTEGYNLTFLPFFIKATVEALKEYPQLNSQWAGDTIIQKRDINISIAVATDEALFVPVIKQADEKTVKGLAREIHDLAGKVRSGKLGGSDMQGGTFTVNNTGSFGSVLSQPIINYPQAAIMSVESIVKRPVVMDTEAGEVIAVRHMANLCLSLDHRVLDGLVCGRFLASVKAKLEAMGEETSIY
ncbi:dihydrolipoamide acetyltransferase family protein [Shouchella shacheensis]|uniref:dihydrolipoamide acetyltransferase family protein n=1 Tax=Shouchella shacheensis TaxID=1649580 RepID=UPI00073FB31E|nr:dihydrolipoamide acetyltransferase family protein [Shouchella shacheensis]